MEYLENLINEVIYYVNEKNEEVQSYISIFNNYLYEHSDEIIHSNFNADLIGFLYMEKNHIFNRKIMSAIENIGYKWEIILNAIMTWAREICKRETRDGIICIGEDLPIRDFDLHMIKGGTDENMLALPEIKSIWEEYVKEHVPDWNTCKMETLTRYTKKDMNRIITKLDHIKFTVNLVFSRLYNFTLENEEPYTNIYNYFDALKDCTLIIRWIKTSLRIIE